MRLSVGTLRQSVKRDLPIEFVPQQLTSYGGLELFRRYVRRLALRRRLHTACAALGGDYSGARLALLVLALLYVGARRLEHLRYLTGDPLIRRFCGLTRLPTARTVGNWLRRFTQETLRPLVQLNQDLVLDAVATLRLPRLTLDVDGTVVRLNIPPLTEERRKELVKVVHKRMEEARVEIRNIRRDANDHLKREERDGGVGTDESHRQVDSLQKTTDKHIAEVDRRGAAKEQEVLEV